MQDSSTTKLGLCSTTLLLSLVLGAGCGDDGGDARVPAALKADLQGVLDDAVARQLTPGAVIHIAAGDGETWSTAAGVAELQQRTAMTADDRFRAGSILKSFVATAVLQQVEAGTLALDDVLTDHLPPAVTARIADADRIQLRMLLAHRSGTPDWITDAVKQAAVADPEHVWSLAEIVEQVESQPAEFPPGEGYAYSNTNCILLGEILGGVTGRSWRDVVRDDVIAPAGLAHTLLPTPGDTACPAPCAHGYLPLGAELLDVTRVDPSMAGASGGHALITSAADLTRFLQELRRGGLFEQASTVDAMFAFQPAPDPMSHTTGYGFGVMQFDAATHDALGHLGTTAGYRSFMLYVPATDRYVSGSINVMGDIGAVLQPIVDRVATP